MSRHGDAPTGPAPAGPVQLQAEALCCRFGDRVLFDHWSCRLGPGLTWVLGGEGSGKSTLLRLLAGEQHADAGALRLGAVDLQAAPQAYRSQVFLADPRTDAHDQISALDYLAGVQDRYRGFDSARVAPLIDGLGLTEHQHKPIYMLSTGSRRKVWFAAAVACGAPLTLVDEPFAGLDRRSIAFVCQVLADCAQDRDRIWVLADYEAPDQIPLAHVLTLD